MTLEEMAKIIEAEASVLSYDGKLAVANCIKDNNYNSKAFTTPATFYSQDSYQAAEDSEAGRRRFPGYRILQFRSFTKYSDGNGNPDDRLIYSGICPIPKDYAYLGKDGIEPYGHFYYGLPEQANDENVLKLTIVYDNLNDKVNLRSDPRMGNNIIGQIGVGGEYTVVGRSDDKAFWKLKSGCWISSNPTLTRTYYGQIVDYQVRVVIDDLNIRDKPTVSSQSKGHIAPGVYTIVEECHGAGASKWLLLKSYLDDHDGWISADYCIRI